MATYHVKPSKKYGWHYHCHLVAEMDDVVDQETLFQGINESWRKAVSKHQSHLDYKEVFMRKVTGPGEALTGMKENTQLDFWSEPQDAVEKVLHYVIRDVLQGIEGWVKALEQEEDVYDFCDFMGAMKRHRTYGKWRKKVEDDESEKKVELEEKPVSELTKVDREKKGDAFWSELSTMDACLIASKIGSSESREALKKLLGCTNRSQGTLFRLRKLTTWLAA